MRFSGRAVALVGVSLFFIAFVFVPMAIQAYADWLWYQELGYERVFITERLARLLLAVIVGTLTFGFIWANLHFAQRGVVPDPVIVRFNPGAPQVDLTQSVRRFTMPIALVIGLFAGLSLSGAWLLLLRAFKAAPFGRVDPVFGRDIAYYVQTLPMIELVTGFIFALAVLGLLVTVPIYWFRGDIILPPRPARVEPSASRHVGSLLAVLFVTIAVHVWLVRVPELLYSTTGPLRGASYTDLYASLPALRFQAVIALAAAVWIIVGMVREKLIWHAAVAASAYFLLALVSTAGYPAIIQRFVVGPTELTRERPYLERHIQATRESWGLDGVTVRDIAGDAGLTLADIRRNTGTIENVRLWERDPLLQTFGQLQEIRTYYDFISADDDRYWIDGRYRQVLLSPRELNTASLPTRTFINEHLTFTHGMGVTLAPVNQVTIEGLPVLFIKDLPPVSNVSLEVTRPQIYFGELTNQHVFVGTRQREFDYPAGESNVFTAYDGAAGVQVGSLARRLMLAARFGSMKVLLSGDITSESRVIYHRNIAERARRALPFLRFDADPYLVIAPDGTLQWIMDAYTATNRYPYAAQAADGTNYMRNSVKVLIDAYHGTVTPYVSDPNDPLIITFDRIFPGILQPIDELPEGLRAHLRYPEDLYRLQTEIYQTYHMDDAEEFYHREDQWQIPTMQQRNLREPMRRRIIMRLPEESREEFIFMTPYTPRGKDNLAAWMVARNDGEHYGALVVYRFPRQSLIYGPQQIMNRINQDTEIARQLTLWDQRGSTVIRGELLVIPIQESLLYVQPIYLRAEGGRIPELKRVVVAYQNQVVMEETLDNGLARLFGGPVERATPILADAPIPERPPVVTPTPTPGTAVTAELIRRAQEHYDRAVAAQRNGDWTRYGEELERLGEVLRQLRGAGQ
ncbi:MAG TPA: UPF0182 family protein [Gemmatimonadaceae bacterium]|nr:UPF0182 family protein [Gemmatimonadaceae bacterium]